MDYSTNVTMIWAKQAIENGFDMLFRGVQNFIGVVNYGPNVPDEDAMKALKVRPINGKKVIQLYQSILLFRDLHIPSE